ncbi:MAG: (d)CMP kinase [Alloprevotella sp.]|nr:(d)CMP kinase [Bacteroidales bacterium]MDY3944204.1 (d)CMP kinase [Alloprevotella sp.]
MRKIIIAIDGHSSCGKSTMAKALARELGYIYVDTGAMYRACTLFAIRNGLFNGDTLDADRLASLLPTIEVGFRLCEATGLPHVTLNGEDVEEAVRTMEVSTKVSPVAALPAVRTAMTTQQQRMGEAKGIVMDGRDIGTVVFPHAELKVFVTARPEVRAQRRFDELQAKGQAVSFEEILHNVQERDRIDSTRAVAPLRPAEDALILDNSDLTREAQAEWLFAQAKARMA